MKQGVLQVYLAKLPYILMFASLIGVTNYIYCHKLSLIQVIVSIVVAHASFILDLLGWTKKRRSLSTDVTIRRSVISSVSILPTLLLVKYLGYFNITALGLCLLIATFFSSQIIIEKIRCA
jgi:hypothetical protein